MRLRINLIKRKAYYLEAMLILFLLGGPSFQGYMTMPKTNQSLWPTTEVKPKADMSSPHQQMLQAFKSNNYVVINNIFDNLHSDWPIDYIKAVAWVESGWKQFDRRGRPMVSYVRTNPADYPHDGGDWGIMQINLGRGGLNRNNWNIDKVKQDPLYNIKAGMSVLDSKKKYLWRLKQRDDWQDLQSRYNLHGRSHMAMVLKAYNGMQPSWSYVLRVEEALKTKPWMAAIKRQAALNPVRVTLLTETTPTDHARQSRGLMPRQWFIFPNTIAGHEREQYMAISNAIQSNHYFVIHIQDKPLAKHPGRKQVPHHKVHNHTRYAER